MRTTRHKILRWIVIIAIPLIGFPLLVTVVGYVLVSGWFDEPYEIEPIEVYDLGGDFFVERWSVNETRIDYFSDENDNEPLLGITPAYLIGKDSDGLFDTSILYATVDSLYASELGQDDDFRAMLDDALGNNRPERYRHYTSNVLDPPVCVGVDLHMRAIVIFFFEFSDGSASCKGRTEAALASKVRSKDTIDLVD